jgi:uncharacterized membrane protein YhaH (DUF805 family)
MDESSSQRWLTTAILIGLLYFAVGIAFGALAGTAASAQTQFFWRLSAFIVSALVFAVHIAYEHFRLRNRPRSTAWHAAMAVACGGFALALMANIHDLGTAAGYRPRMLIALGSLAPSDRCARVHCRHGCAGWPQAAGRPSQQADRGARYKALTMLLHAKTNRKCQWF